MVNYIYFSTSKRRLKIIPLYRQKVSLCHTRILVIFVKYSIDTDEFGKYDVICSIIEFGLIKCIISKYTIQVNFPFFIVYSSNLR